MAAPDFRPRDTRTAVDIGNPAAGDRRVWFRNYIAATVNEINAVLDGSGSPSVTFSIRFDADRSATGTELLTGGRTITNTTTGISYAPDVTVIPANVWVWFEITAQSGVVEEINLAMDLTP